MPFKSTSLTQAVAPLLLCLLGASCGSRTAAPQPGNNPAPSATGASTRYEFPVRMRPQSALDSAPKSVSLAQPSFLPAQPPAVRRTSASGDTVAVDGSSFDTSLATNLVFAEGGFALFRPVWDSGVYDTIQDVSYASYRIDLDGYTGDPTIGMKWAEKAAIVREGKYWLALANRQRDHWDWFSGPLDNVLTLDSLAPYKDQYDELLLVVAVIFREQAGVLQTITVGQPEMRGTGLEISDFEISYKVPPVFTPALPASADLTAGCAPVNDQQTWGACTAFAVGDGAFNYELGANYGSLGWNLTLPQQRVSPKYLYIMSGEIQGFPPDPGYGRYTDDVAQNLVHLGISTEQHAPYDLVYAKNWGAAAGVDAGLLKPLTRYGLPCTSPAGIDTVKGVLAFQQRPVVLSTQVDYGFFDYTPGEVWDYQGPSCGGHAMLIVGYDEAKQAFKVRNSWGPDWGDEGHLWMSYASLRNPYNYYVQCLYLVSNYDPAVAQHFLGTTASLLPPQGLEASDGAHAAKIVLTWTPVTGATGYKIFRDSMANEVASVGAVNSWEDTNVTDALAHAYWIKTVSGAQSSALSAGELGFVSQTPEIIGVSPQGGAEGVLVRFTPEAMGNPPVSFHWDFGGGAYPNTSQAATPQVQLAAEGTYTVTLTMTSGAQSDSFQFPLTISQNAAPINHWFYAPGPFPAPYTFSKDAAAQGSGVGDNDGFIVLYEWDWDNDGVFDLVTTSPAVEHIFNEGIHTIGLRVIDDGGKSAFATNGFTVGDPPEDDTPPVASFGLQTFNKFQPPLDTKVNQLSYDNDGTIVLYEFDFDNDGTYEISGTEPAPTHTFMEHGTYTVNMRVTDDDSLTGTASTTLRVGIGSTVPGWDLHMIASLTGGDDMALDASLVDGRPAVAFVSTGKDRLWYAASTVASPGATADWTVAPLTAEWEAENKVGLTDLAGQPAISYFDSVENKISLAYNGGTGWAFHNLHAVNGPTGMGNAIAVVDGKLVIAYRSNRSGQQGLYYARSTAAIPAGAGDWTLMQVYPSTGISNFLALSEVNGKPVISCYGSDSGSPSLLYAEAGTQNPSVSGDWASHFAGADSSAGYYPGVLTLGGKPLTLFAGGGQAQALFATSAAPAGSADWLGMPLGPGYPLTAGLAGTVCYLAFTESTGNNPLMLASTTSVDPQLPSDWSSEALWICRTAEGRLLEVDGKPALVFYDRASFTLYFAYPTP